MGLKARIPSFSVKWMITGNGMVRQLLLDFHVYELSMKKSRIPRHAVANNCIKLNNLNVIERKSSM